MKTEEKTKPNHRTMKGSPHRRAFERVRMMDHRLVNKPKPKEGE